MKRSVHEDYLFIVNNDLLLITRNKTIMWMMVASPKWTLGWELLRQTPCK